MNGQKLHYHYHADGAWRVDATSFGAMSVAGRHAAVFKPAVPNTEVFFRGTDGYLHRYYVDPKLGWQYDGKSCRVVRVRCMNRVCV